MKSIVPLLIALMFLVSFSTAHADEGSLPKFIAARDGYVPDAEMAIKIAEAVWVAHFGKWILEKGPFTAQLHGDTWYVEGSLPQGIQETRGGGGPEAEISKSTGEIKRMNLAR